MESVENLEQTFQWLGYLEEKRCFKETDLWEFGVNVTSSSCYQSSSCHIKGIFDMASHKVNLKAKYFNLVYSEHEHVTHCCISYLQSKLKQ